MSINYPIDYSDPLKPGFTIPNNTFNSTASSLRLYGRNFLNWGEGYNENLLRLVENFASATAPLNPTEGQLWYKVSLYWYNSVTPSWFRWNYTTSQWDNITPLVTSGPTPPPTPNAGDYWFNTTTNKLHRYDQQYKQNPFSWLERARINATVNPTNGTDYPKIEVLMRSSNDWRVPPTVISTAADVYLNTVATEGQLFFDTSTNTLQVYDGASWLTLLTSGAILATADLDMNNFKIINLADATNPQDALNMQTGDARYVNVSGDTMIGTLTLNADPVNALEAATKQYVDNVATGLDFKQSVRLATTTNIASLSGIVVIDGVTPVNGDRVLVKNQSTASQNGIYNVNSAGSWVRASDADNSPTGEVRSGMYCFVEEGLTNADSGWVLTTNDPITLGVTNLTFAQFTGLGQISVGSGLIKSGNTLYIDSSVVALQSNITYLMFYDIAGGSMGKLRASTPVLNFAVVRSFSLPANCVGSYAQSQVGGVIPYTFTLQKNGSTFGSINFGIGATNGTFASSAMNFIPGDWLTVMTPGAIDTVFSGLRITLKGTLL